MLIKLIFLLLIVSILEIHSLLRVHALIGLFPTVALVLLTAFAGAYLLRLQGTQTLLRLGNELNSGRLPGNELLDGIFILLGGMLLLAPGFFTDLAGFLLLIPTSRAWARSLLFSYLRRRVSGGTIRIYTP